MDCKRTASVLELTNRRLFEPQKLQKRVSFKDEAWVIHIPAREENDKELRESVVLRNAVAGRSGLTNRAVTRLTPNRRTSLETLSRTSLYANRDQRTPQTQSYMTGSGRSVTTRGPFKSILKTPTPIRKKEDHLNRSQPMPARYFREVSEKNSVDSYLKQELSHLLPSKDSVNTLEKPVLTRNLPTRRSLTISRALSSDNDLRYNKTGRFVGKEFTAPSRTPIQHNFNHNERTKTATQQGRNFNIVGVTYRSVNETPYFYDIKGLAGRMNEYPSDAKSPLNDRARLEHSSVSTSLDQSGSRREERYLSAIPAIEAFNRRNRGTRRYSSSAWTHEQVASPKKQLPIAWQAAKQYNFSTK